VRNKLIDTNTVPDIFLLQKLHLHMDAWKKGIQLLKHLLCMSF